MYVVYSRKLDKFKYYMYKPFKLEGTVYNVFDPPPLSISYEDWVTLFTQLDYDYICFYSTTFLANNYIKENPKRIIQPRFIALFQVLSSLKLNKNYYYLIFNAGGNKTKIMPAYNCLTRLSKFQYKKFYSGEFDKKLYPTNVITMDNHKYSRARFKCDYLDVVVGSLFDVIIGAETFENLSLAVEKGLKEATKYLIIFAPKHPKIEQTATTIFYADDYDYYYYVWNLLEKDKATNYLKIKRNYITKADFIELRRISE